jgi:hypothetical protein
MSRASEPASCPEWTRPSALLDGASVYDLLTSSFQLAVEIAAFHCGLVSPVSDLQWRRPDIQKIFCPRCPSLSPTTPASRSCTSCVPGGGIAMAFLNLRATGRARRLHQAMTECRLYQAASANYGN